MKDNVKVTFIKSYENNKEGDTKTIKNDVANYLIKKGYCVIKETDNKFMTK